MNNNGYSKSKVDIIDKVSQATQAAKTASKIESTSAHKFADEIKAE